MYPQDGTDVGPKIPGPWHQPVYRWIHPHIWRFSWGNDVFPRISKPSFIKGYMIHLLTQVVEASFRHLGDFLWCGHFGTCRHMIAEAMVQLGIVMVILRMIDIIYYPILLIDVLLILYHTYIYIYWLIDWLIDIVEVKSHLIPIKSDPMKFWGSPILNPTKGSILRLVCSPQSFASHSQDVLWIFFVGRVVPSPYLYHHPFSNFKPTHVHIHV